MTKPRPAFQALEKEAMAMEKDAPRLAAKAVELTQQLQKDEEVCPVSQASFLHIPRSVAFHIHFLHPWRYLTPKQDK